MTDTNKTPRINCLKCGFAREPKDIKIHADAFRGNVCRFCIKKRAKPKKWDDVKLSGRDY